MKKTAIYMMGAVFAAAALAGCDDNFETPPVYWPVADANTTVESLKTQYWKSDRNYVETVGKTAEDKDMVIRGRVVSDMSTGNIYNSIVIQSEDGTGLNIAVRTNKLGRTYDMGQVISVNVTDMKIGGYNGLMQLGAEGNYNNAPSMTFMESADFEGKCVFEGSADPEEIVVTTVTIPEVNQAKQTAEGLIKYQSRLVRIEGVTFDNPGQPWAGDQNTNRTFKDAAGNSMIVRTSSYASFKNERIPAGKGNLVGILSYYGTDWQILINNPQSACLDFDGVLPDNPDVPGGDGTKDNPYNVAQVIAGTGTGSSAWVKGYIVGSSAGKTAAEMTNATGENASGTNVFIADTPDQTDPAKCVPVQLNTTRAALNLKDNPSNLGKQVSVYGSLEAYFGQPGVKTVTDYVLEGGETPDVPDVPGDPVTSLNEGFEKGSLPAGWKSYKISGDKDWYFPEFSGNHYAAMTGYKGTQPPFDAWLVSPAVDIAKCDSKILTFETQVNGYGSTTSVLEAYVLDNQDPAKATVKTKLDFTLATVKEGQYSGWVSSGNVDLSKFTGNIYIAWRFHATQDANYATWCVDNVKLNAN